MNKYQLTKPLNAADNAGKEIFVKIRFSTRMPNESLKYFSNRRLNCFMSSFVIPDASFVDLTLRKLIRNILEI